MIHLVCRKRAAPLLYTTFNNIVMSTYCMLYGLSNGSRCLLALGDVEEAQKAFEMCLKSNHLSSLDRKIVKEASDGLQKTQVASRLSFGYHLILNSVTD